jgi:hypothetical protein
MPVVVGVEQGQLAIVDRPVEGAEPPDVLDEGVLLAGLGGASKPGAEMPPSAAAYSGSGTTSSAFR